MKLAQFLLAVCALFLTATARAEKITVAAAADLKFAMDEIVVIFKKTNPGDDVDVMETLHKPPSCSVI